MPSEHGKSNELLSDKDERADAAKGGGVITLLITLLLVLTVRPADGGNHPRKEDRMADVRGTHPQKEIDN